MPAEVVHRQAVNVPEHIDAHLAQGVGPDPAHGVEHQAVEQRRNDIQHGDEQHQLPYAGNDFFGGSIARDRGGIPAVGRNGRVLAAHQRCAGRPAAQTWRDIAVEDLAGQVRRYHLHPGVRQHEGDEHQQDPPVWFEVVGKAPQRPADVLRLADLLGQHMTSAPESHYATS